MVRDAPARTGIRRRALAAIGAVLSAAALSATGCGSPPPVSESAPAESAPAVSEPAPSASADEPAPEAAPAPCADRIARSLDASSQAGQLVMVGTAPTEPAEPVAELARRLKLGGVFLAGRSRGGMQSVADRTRTLRGADPDSQLGLLVAADQEGGQIQALSGPGFSTIPSAEEQGTWTPIQLQTAAAGWGAEMRKAGINLNLAPVADVLNPTLGARNLAVGKTRRTYGTTAAAVGPHVLAFIDGLRSAGVATSVKHFPGLGRVAPNTDYTPDVRDDSSGPDSSWVQPFRAAIEHGVPVVMVSSVVYTRVDPSGPAAFSTPVIDGLLRKRFGFDGVVISDDLSNAVAVAAVPKAQRAARFVAAGGDVALTVDPKAAGPMVDSLLARMSKDAGFAARVRASVARVLAVKESLGLLTCR